LEKEKKMTANHVVLGTGAIGRAIMDELVKRGESVRMVNRSGKMAEVPSGVELIASDLYDQVKVKDVASGARVVYQASQPKYNEWTEKFPALQKSILDGLTGSNVTLVIVENTYMYGATNGTPMTEDTPHNPHTRKGRLRAGLSEATLAAHRAGKLRVTAGRGADFFGPWGLPSSMGERTFFPLLHGKAGEVTGRVDIPHTYTFTKDFGKALVLLGERSEAEGQAWHVPNDRPHITQGELLKMFAEEAGVTVKTYSMGKFGWSVLGLFAPAAKEMVEMVYEFDQPFVVDSSKFEKTFGMKATPMKKAVKETVAWYKSHSQEK
jgi:nucleoside-diphosphate-sugar epimerase